VKSAPLDAFWNVPKAAPTKRKNEVVHTVVMKTKSK